MPWYQTKKVPNKALASNYKNVLERAKEKTKGCDALY
jgi:hypothetical protein